MTILNYDVIIIGAGAAGLMAAIQAGKRGRKTLLIEHTNKIGEKIRISGGGRCNFTNLNISNHNYLSQNIHFVKSALANFSQYDFIKLVENYNIEYYEKTLGQLFCKQSSKQIIDMLLDLCNKYGVEIKLNCIVNEITKSEKFNIITSTENLSAESLIIATGGLSIPKMGATDFGYKIANKFNLNIIPTKPALVPLIINDIHKNEFSKLSGVSNYSEIKYNNITFKENILFTHKGLSGPAILQISSYLKNFNLEITIDLLPDIDIKQLLIDNKNSKQNLANYLKTFFVNRLVDNIFVSEEFQKSLTNLNKKTLLNIAENIHNFKVKISDNEGYDKAEVTIGGVDTDEISSKTMEVKKIKNLYFIGEVVDVTGWLGGYNFQWAWSSGFVAGNNA